MTTKSDGERPSLRQRLSAVVSARWLGSKRVLAAAALLLVLGGGALGYATAKTGVLHDFRVAALDPALASVRRAMGRVEESRWELYETHLGNIEKLTVSVADRDGAPMAALEEMDGHFVFLTQTGHLTDLAPDHVLHDLDIDVPMNPEDVRAANLPRMDLTLFRALDLLAVPVGEHSFDLYASYNRYQPDRRCFDIAVSRMHIATSESALRPESGWELVYATQPCVPPRTAQTQFGAAFIGIQSGGRLALRDPNTLLFSVGDLEFDGVMYPGVADAPNGPQDPAWDTGKVQEIDLATGRARHFAIGLRNPQGLLVMNDGRVFETEHGPYGGDEINLLRRGLNYGWPNVTYGMMYEPLRANWPLNTTHGGHEGYERPAYVFVPSIGISQLAQPSAEEFPFWSSALLLTSLRGRALYVLRLDGDRIMWAEPLPFGERLRDIISRPNGEIAVLTDAGNLVFIRAVDERDSHEGYVLTDARGPRQRESRVEAGRRLFAANCQACHRLDGQPSAGPPLNGVVGRDIASTDFEYSAALQSAEGAWTRRRLTEFLTAENSLPGSTMPPPHLSRTQASDLIAYLRSAETP